MSFEVDRNTSAWAHIALCADLTWASEPPDEFTRANQRLWAQYCRVSQVLQDQAIESQGLKTNNQCELAEKHSNSCRILENGSSSCQLSIKDVIPDSRLAQYGNFYYDEVREKCYANANESSNRRGYKGQGCENSDLTECWMLPEVEYWFRRLVDEQSERAPRRRRQYRIVSDDDCERWDVAGSPTAAEEAALVARVRSVRPIWDAPSGTRTQLGAPNPPSTPRKMRARRRPRRVMLAPPQPRPYCLETPVQLYCDPTCKFQFHTPRQHLVESQRAAGRLTASVQAIMRAAAARCPCPPYRGTNITRYAPNQRPVRCPRCVIWPREYPKLDHRCFTHTQYPVQASKPTTAPPQEIKPQRDDKETNSDHKNASTSSEPPTAPEKPMTASEPSTVALEQPSEKLDSPKPIKQQVVDDELPSTSAAALETGLWQKRLYSTVLSMSPPPPIALTPVGCFRLSGPAILKLKPTARGRPPAVDQKFEDLEKEALDQYKASDESIDTKFRELEKQAVEEYGTSNSNTSCSSGNSAEKGASTSPLVSESNTKINKQTAKFPKEKAVGSVVIYSQNFPEESAKGQTASVTNLKNCHTPLRGEKKEPTHRSSKTLRNLKNESQRAASDTDYDSRGTKGKGPARCKLHLVPPKKRHLTLCVSDYSSDEELKTASASAKNGPRVKNRAAGKLKMSAHGGGDLHPIRKRSSELNV